MNSLWRKHTGANKLPVTEFKDGLSDSSFKPKTKSDMSTADKQQLAVSQALQSKSFQAENLSQAAFARLKEMQTPYYQAANSSVSNKHEARAKQPFVKTEDNLRKGAAKAKQTVYELVNAKNNEIDNGLSGSQNLLRQKHMHLGILLMIIAMLCFGLVMIFSASMNIGMYANNNPFFYINRQYVATLIGLFVMFVVANIDIRAFNRLFFVVLYYLGTMGLLLLVLIPSIGTFYNGQRRWLKIPFSGNTTFQPSEIAKVGVPFILAFYFSTITKLRDQGYFNLQSAWQQRWLDGFVDIAFPTLIVLSWCLPISLQSHMSAVFIMLLLTFVLLLVMRLPWRSWLYGGSELAALFLAFVLMLVVLKPLLPANFTRRWDHLAKRVEIFKVQNQDEEEAKEKKIDVDTYHSDQAFIAIASGGLTGTGLGQGKQKLNYLPEGHNDYIFSNIVEELGFIGGCSVLSMFIIFFIIGCSVVTRTIGIYPRLISFGYLFLLTIQGVLSIAVNVGVIPPTGISMPFFSFGGTSNVFFLFAAGCILSISKFAVRPSIAQKQEVMLAEQEIKQKFKDQGLRV